MFPRKRQRPNPADTTSSAATSHPPAEPRLHAQPTSTSPTLPPPSQEEPSEDGEQMAPPKPGRSVPSQSSLQQVRKSQSWYGSWPRVSKASPSTSVTQENIFGGSVRPERTPNLSRFDQGETQSTRSGSSISRGPGNGMQDPDDTKKTADEGHSRGPGNGTQDPDDTKKTADEGNASENVAASDDANAVTAETADTNDNDNVVPPPEPGTTDATTPDKPAPSTGWLGWWSRTPVTDTQKNTTVENSGTATAATPAPAPAPAEKKDTDDAATRPSTAAEHTAPPDQPVVESQEGRQRASTWFGFWPVTSTSAPSKSDAGDKPTSEADQTKSTGEDGAMPDAQQPTVEQQQQQQQRSDPAPKAGSTWAFWSRDTPKGNDRAAQQDPGEIAVMGEGSEAHPTPMVEGNISPPPKDTTKNKKDEQSGGMLSWRRSSKRSRPQSVEYEAPSPSASGTSTPQGGQAPSQQLPTAPAQTQVRPEGSTKSMAESEAATKAQKNLLLPSFSNTYQMKQDPSIIKQIAQLVLRSRDPPMKHVFRVKEPPKIRKAISIGIHGLLPATYLRPMIGQPTGTSLRFASLGAEAIRRWADSHGSSDCEIEKVALEGEGKINDRVDNLWRLMLNWIDHIRHADLILLSCHSQGVPVSIMLIEKLIDLGIVTKAKIGVCAMAGVSMGPFPEYKSSMGMLMGSAAELWEFGNPESANSQRFEAALKRALDYGARITFIGSIDDQLVPMESAVYSPANHPYIYRAVFIDGRVHAPDFISHLVGFALKLRNLGVSEHGLIRELSVPLAGSLYSGEGHSRLYYDDQVYDLAISNALETTDVPGHPECEIRHHHNGAVPSGHQQGPNSSSSSSNQNGGGASQAQQQQQPPNPYVLPWIMRGLLEEEFVKTELSQETEQLLRQFDNWRPANKALKDVKYRLEAVRSKL